MKGLIVFWKSMPRGSQLRLGIGAALIVMATIAVGVWSLRTPYEVLFSELNEGDAASIVEQLKKQKQPYALAEDGTTIKVPAPDVHETRLRLMSSGTPLAGGVGFEIFDKQGLGATEQSQRVSYQRALQGELARTIGTLDDVKQARVHLVLPESTLFKRDRQEARAAVTLTLKPGAALRREQILGIERLVAASVGGLEPERVVVTDQRGVTLSGTDALGRGAGVSEARLDMKREIEDYVTRKVARLLDSTYGPGQAIVSADVLLNFDEITRTVQDLLPARENGGIRRRKQVLSGSGSGVSEDSSEVQPGAAPANSSSEVEYEYGRSVEQVIAAPGGIGRMSIGVIVPGDLSLEKQKRITDLVRMAAGINEERGDAIVVQPLDQLGTGTAQTESPAVIGEPASSGQAAPTPHLAASGTTFQWPAWASWAALLVALAILILMRRRRAVLLDSSATNPLTHRQRQQLLLDIQRSLDSSASLDEAELRS